ncbi:WD40 repeat domain-containing protein [Sphingobacterium sp. Mn56C]|uniref:WD40 domain-containing protein n=1 Tax=Sphingobacterium sp. Mn56C TaxID=3395261 RepID=UPI003BCFDA69
MITLLQTLNGHQNPVYTLEMDIPKQLLYSAGNDKGVVEWDLQTLAFKRVLCAVPSSVYALHQIPGTSYLAVGMRSGDLFVVDTHSQTLKAKLKIESGSIFCIRSLVGKQELVVIGESGKAYVYRLTDFQLLYTFQISDTTIRSIAVYADESALAFGDKNGVIYLISAVDYQLIAKAKIHDMSITSLCFVGKSLYSGGRDAKMYKLDYPSLEVALEITPHLFTVYSILPLHKNGFISTVSRDKTIKIWNSDLKLQKNISRDKGIASHFLSINSQAYHPELGLLATAGDDKAIHIWQISLT